MGVEQREYEQAEDEGLRSRDLLAAGDSLIVGSQPSLMSQWNIVMLYSHINYDPRYLTKSPSILQRQQSIRLQSKVSE